MQKVSSSSYSSMPLVTGGILNSLMRQNISWNDVIQQADSLGCLVSNVSNKFFQNQWDHQTSTRRNKDQYSVIGHHTREDLAKR